MDTKDSAATPLSSWPIKDLMEAVGRVADELLARGTDTKNRDNVECARLYLKSSAKLVEARAYMRDLASALRSAAPVPDTRHGAEQPGAELDLRRGEQKSVTTTGAAESCRFMEASSVYEHLRCMRPAGHQGDHLVGAVAGPLHVEPLTAESRGQRGPQAAEGAGAAGRAEQGPVDLSDHLRLVKSEGGSR